MKVATVVLLLALALGVSAAAEEPLPRHGHRMVYDSSRKAVVMFGGRTHDKNYLGDIWSWDGETWTQVAAAGPGPRAWFGLAYDTSREVLVLFGGRDASGEPRADTWELRGTQWTLVAEAGPEPRDHHAMVYDPARAPGSAWPTTRPVRFSSFLEGAMLAASPAPTRGLRPGPSSRGVARGL